MERMFKGLFGVAVLLATLGLGQEAKAWDPCTAWYSFDVAPHVYQNNPWGSNHTESGSWQCVWSNGNSNWGADFNWISKGGDAYYYVKGWPSLYRGYYDRNHEITNTPGSGLPRAVSDIGRITATWTWQYNNNDRPRLNASWDIWIDESYGSYSRNANQRYEIMVWPYRNGDDVNSAGRYFNTVNIGGTAYDVYVGTLGSQDGSWTVISYISKSPTQSVYGLNLSDFINDAVSKHGINNRYYLQAIHAGWEVFGGAGSLQTTSYKIDGL